MAAPPAIGFCACCTPSLLRPQSDVLNRPGLSAISYRVGSFATFRQALLESIASEPRLAALTSRAGQRNVLFVLVAFPLVLPLLLTAIAGTLAATRGGDAWTSLRVLIAYDGAASCAAYLLAEAAWED